MCCGSTPSWSARAARPPRCAPWRAHLPLHVGGAALLHPLAMPPSLPGLRAAARNIAVSRPVPMLPACLPACPPACSGRVRRTGTGVRRIPRVLGRQPGLSLEASCRKVASTSCLTPCQSPHIVFTATWNCTPKHGVPKVYILHRAFGGSTATCGAHETGVQRGVAKTRVA